jgi:hypothetical protein
MKERSKEKIADLLMDELLSQLSERGNLRRMLGEMTGLPIGPLIEDLVTEFEQVVEQYRLRSVTQADGRPVEPAAKYGERYTTTETPSIPLPVSPREEVLPQPSEEALSGPPDERPPASFGEVEETDREEEPIAASSQLQEEKDLSSEEDAELAQPAGTAGEETIDIEEEFIPEVESQVQAAPEDVRDFRHKLEELAKRVESEYLEKLERGRKKAAPGAGPVERKAEVPEERAPVESEQQVKRIIEVGRGEGGKPSRIPYKLDDKDYIYISAVMKIPEGEAPGEGPFMLEEKGIDGKDFAFALDHNGLRLFLSRIRQNEMNVSRKGLLLLGKGESLQLRGQHESILNELRAHGIILPVEFATVARGKEDLRMMVQKHFDDLEEALAVQAKTKWWKVGLYVLDARIAQLFAEEGGGKQERGGRERGRLSFTTTVQPKKYDVKMLEKILQKEKKLAESVHADLSASAERSEIQSMVGLGSGSSDEWKLILQATYLVPSTVALQRFTRAVTDLQYRHILFEPMLSMVGDTEAFSFLKK